MDIHNLEQIKQEFSGFQQEFETGNKEKALEKLLELLDALEEEDNSKGRRRLIKTEMLHCHRKSRQENRRQKNQQKTEQAKVSRFI